MLTGTVPDVTLYDRLGATPEASSDELRRAFVARARQHHPDLESDPARRRAAERRMQEVNAAWSVLGDPARRAAYDRSLGIEAGSVPKRGWQPVEPDDPGEVDPRDLLDDTPIGDGGRLPRSLQVAPPLLVLCSVGGFVIGAFTAIPGLVALGLVLGVVGLVLFLAAPLVAVLRARD
jgi:hypothetical protein